MFGGRQPARRLLRSFLDVHADRRTDSRPAMVEADELVLVQAFNP